MPPCIRTLLYLQLQEHTVHCSSQKTIPFGTNSAQSMPLVKENEEKNGEKCKLAADNQTLINDHNT